MQTATMDVSILKEMLRGVVREVIQEEMLKLKLSLIPTVSDSEMEEINRELGEPGQYEEEEYETLDL